MARAWAVEPSAPIVSISNLSKTYATGFRALKETFNGVLFFNPGAAGKPRFGSKPTVGLLEIRPEGLRLRHQPLSLPFPSR